MARKVFNVRVEEEVLANLKVMADADNRTLTNLIETILIQYVEEKKEERE